MKLTIEYGDIKASINLNKKITIISDKSGKGKTTIAEAITESRRLNESNVVSYISIVDVPTLPEDVNIVVLDEDSIVFLRRKKALVKLLKNDCYFILITRSSLKEINYSHRDIYVLRSFEGVYTLVRKYENYNVLYKTPDYIEDKGYGFLYYSKFYKDIKSTEGKDNIDNIADKGSFVIADGSSIGPLFPFIKDNYELFLPESFEWLILRKHGMVPDISMSSNPEKDYFKECKKLPVSYNKSKLNSYFIDFKYIEDFTIKDSVIDSYLIKYKCNCDISTIREYIYNIQGDYDIDTTIKTAIAIHTLNNKYPSK